MKKLVIANWKMNPTSLREAKKIAVGIQKEATKVKGVQVVVCPPTAFLSDVAKEVKGPKVQVGVQDIFCEESGAFTGQTSVGMVQAYKAKWAIVGHSERRALGESNALVAQKAQFAIRNGLTAVVCVGEKERNEEGDYYNFVREELEAVFAGLKRKELDKLVIAYEPIWAIGKSAGEAMQTAQLFEMTLFIKKLMIERFGRAPAENTALLYGGSVKPDNAEELMREGGVDGLLVGGASLDAKAFGEILTSAQL